MGGGYKTQIIVEQDKKTKKKKRDRLRKEEKGEFTGELEYVLDVSCAVGEEGGNCIKYSSHFISWNLWFVI